MIFVYPLSLEPKHYCITFFNFTFITIIYKHLPSHGSCWSRPCFPLVLFSWLRLCLSLGSLLLQSLLPWSLTISAVWTFSSVCPPTCKYYLYNLLLEFVLIISMLFSLLPPFFLIPPSSFPGCDEQNLKYPHGGNSGYSCPLILKALASFHAAGVSGHHHASFHSLRLMLSGSCGSCCGTPTHVTIDPFSLLKKKWASFRYEPILHSSCGPHQIFWEVFKIVDFGGELPWFKFQFYYIWTVLPEWIKLLKLCKFPSLQ